MSAHKRLILAALTAVITAGSTSTANAQIFRRRIVWVSPVVVMGGYDGNPYWYDPWYGYVDQYPWGPYPYPPYRVYNLDPGAALRLDVKPKDAEVYVDGYYAGVVDDFDGAFQRLSVTPGGHEIDLFADGYRAIHQKVYLTPRRTVKIQATMERLPAGEQPEARPQPASPPQGQPGAPPPMYPPPGRGPAGRRGPQGPPPPQPAPPPPPGAPRADASASGSIAIRVQPGDSEILIDGETWRGPEAQDRLLVEVAEGRHTVEIRKSGYRTYVTEVQVKRGETTAMNVSLRTQDER